MVRVTDIVLALELVKLFVTPLLPEVTKQKTPNISAEGYRLEGKG